MKTESPKKEGYYWVKDANGSWEISWFDGDELFYFTGNFAAFLEKDLLEINWNLIINPNE